MIDEAVIYVEFKTGSNKYDAATIGQAKVTNLEIGEDWIKYYGESGKLVALRADSIRLFRIGE